MSTSIATQVRGNVKVEDCVVVDIVKPKLRYLVAFDVCALVQKLVTNNGIYKELRGRDLFT